MLSHFPCRCKVRFAPASFLSLDKKDAIRPLPCSSFPNGNRNRWVAIWVTANGTHAFTFSMPVQSPLCSGVFFVFGQKRRHPPAPLLLLSKWQPQSLGCDLGDGKRNACFHIFHAGAKSALLRRLFCLWTKKTPSARSLAPPFHIATAIA